MKLNRSMLSPGRPAQLLQKFAQPCSGDAMINFAADYQIGALLALILAEPARQANRSVQPMALYIVIDDGQILRVPSRETGTSKANRNFYKAVFLWHGPPL
jgi:hypothetical protein